MSKPLNKIQIPIKTKIAAIFPPTIMIYAFYALYHSFDWYSGVIFLGYGLTFLSLFNGRKLGWYIGLVVFFGIFLLFMPTFTGSMDKNMLTAIVISLANLLGFILLIFDRKNYFAAIDRAKTPAKQI